MRIIAESESSFLIIIFRILEEKKKERIFFKMISKLLNKTNLKIKQEQVNMKKIH